MKLKKLDINNIASVSRASIDFTSAPLADSPIFLICGETGSGKSTILDAICMALYNKTPRLSNGNRTEENIYREGSQEISIVSVNQLLKKGEKEGSIMLQFEGADGTDYLAEWKCRVNRNGKLEDETWSITDSAGHVNNSKGRARMEKMTEIIGLDYDQFCRTSMLAQGQFTQFLKASSQDKSDILEKITGTEIYAAVGDRIHKKAKEASDAFKVADREVDSVKLLNDDVKGAYRKEIAEIEDLNEKNTSNINLLDRMLKAFEAIGSADATIKKCNETLAGAKVTFSSLAADLAYRKDSCANMKEQADRLSAQIEEQKGDSVMYANVQAIESHLGNITRQRGIREEQKTKLEKENGLLTTESEALSAINEKKNIAEDKLAKRNQAVADAIQAKNALDPEGVERERKSIADGLELVRKAGADYATIQSKAENIALAREDYAKVEDEIKADRQSVENLRQKAEEADRQYKEVQAVYNRQAQVLDDAAVRIREWLRETGADECPVCHAKIVSLTTTAQEEDRLRPLKELVEKKNGEKEAANTEFTRARTALTTKESSHATAGGRIKKAADEMKKMKEVFGAKYSSLGITGTEEDLKAILEKQADALGISKTANESNIMAVGEKQKAIDAAVREHDAFLKNEVGPLNDEYNAANTRITKIKGRIDAASTLIRQASSSEEESLRKAHSLISIPDWEKIWEVDAEAFISSLKEKAGAYNAAVKSLEILKESIKNSEKTINEATEVCGKINPAACGFAEESVIPAKFQGNAISTWGSLESTVKKAFEDISFANQIIADNKETLHLSFEANPDLPQSKDELLMKKEELRKEMIDRSTRLGVLRQTIADDDLKAAELKDKIEKRDEASRVNAQWKTLDELFGGKDGFTFKKIAQSYIMQDILNHANSYLRKIAPRYELTAQPGSLVILVKDNEEGGVRSGNTLSGGEGFVISLSLALGLSSLAENSISVDTIFIDEGFGTLSQEWLNSVMAALEKLNATSGKHVGIISHIEDLQKRIPTVIEVRKTNATTSEISIRG